MSRIFISYSHKGNGLAWKDRLLKPLAVFERQHLLDPWHDDEMKLGESWHERINASMQDAKLAVLLLTDEMLKSPFVLNHEFPELRRRHRDEGLIIAPILCEKCDWSADEWITSLQIKPRAQADPKPLASLTKPDCDSALREIATEIAEQISHIALAELPKPDQPLPSDRIYLDKFPLTRGPGLREEKLIGRELELALLDLAFAQPHTAIVSLVAWGGVGKTMLVQHWLQRLQREGWFGARRVYAWSFYSQGTKEDRQASEDTFLAHALEWFGVQCEPKLSPWDKGRLLADAVARERTLLILDGIEPLQYPPGPMGGQLRAPGVQSLLKQLARKSSDLNPQPSTLNQALCLVTTREPLTDLADFQRREGSLWGSVLRVDLGNLTDEAGAALLHHAGANRAGAAEIKSDDTELLAASREVDGHALTLNLLGRFLARAHGGDIRRRDLVKFEEADRAVQGGTTFKMLAAFENWFAKSGEFGARQLAVLRMLGLFDRPADASCIGALRKPPVIAGLTDPLFTTRLDANTGQATVQPLLEEDWNTATSFLADFGLVELEPQELHRILGYSEQEAYMSTVGLQLGEPKPFSNQQSSIANHCSLNAHPLVREFFARRLQAAARKAEKAAHSRLFEHLRNSVPYWPEGLSCLQPLYQAVTHGCHAELFSDAFFILNGRTGRSHQHYSSRKLAAYGAELASLARFFDEPWSKPNPSLAEVEQGLVIAMAAVCLNALGRTEEAMLAYQAAVEISKRQQNWLNAAIDVGSIALTRLLHGDLDVAVRNAQLAETFADRSGVWMAAVDSRAKLAHALHQSGRVSDALASFQTAEALQSSHHPSWNLLLSWSGFVYCDALLAAPERAAWSIHLDGSIGPTKLLPRS